MDKLFHPALYNGCNYLSMMGSNSYNVSKRGSGWLTNNAMITYIWGHYDVFISFIPDNYCNYVIFHRANLWCIILTHWGRVTHICVGKLTIIGSDNGLSPDRRQAIIRTNAGLLLIGPLGTNFNEILIEILTFSFKKMRFKVSSAKWRLFCLGLNELS